MLVMVRSRFLSAIACNLWFTPNNVGQSFNMSEMRLLEPTVLGVFYFCFIKGRILFSHPRGSTRVRRGGEEVVHEERERSHV